MTHSLWQPPEKGNAKRKRGCSDGLVTPLNIISSLLLFILPWAERAGGFWTSLLKPCQECKSDDSTFFSPLICASQRQPCSQAASSSHPVWLHQSSMQNSVLREKSQFCSLTSQISIQRSEPVCAPAVTLKVYLDWTMLKKWINKSNLYSESWTNWLPPVYGTPQFHQSAWRVFVTVGL